MNDCIYKIQTAYKTWSTALKISRNSKCQQTIKAIQAQRLQTIVTYAYENIKYYRELFDENKIKPQSIKSVKDLSTIPYLTKDILRQRFWDFLPGNLPRCKVSRTSGSTGAAMCILADENSRINNSAAVIRYRKKYGIKFFSGDILTPLKTPDTPDKKPCWTFLQGLHKTYYVNPYHYSKSSELILKQLRNPAIIGITPAIKALAISIKDNILPPVSASIVITMGQSYETATRELFKNVFNAPVADVYACNEAGDNILLPDGRTIYWHHIKSIFTHQQLRQFQLIQHHNLSLELKAVIENGADLKQMEKIFRFRLENFTQGAVSFKITETTNIVPCQSGKTKLIVRSSD